MSPRIPAWWGWRIGDWIANGAWALVVVAGITLAAAAITLFASYRSRPRLMWIGNLILERCCDG